MDSHRTHVGETGASVPASTNSSDVHVQALPPRFLQKRDRAEFEDGTSAPSGPKKRTADHHKVYLSCKSGTQRLRDACIDSIRDFWRGVSQQDWLPQAIAPTREIGGRTKERSRVELRDLSTNFLESLVGLARLTVDDHAYAGRMLGEAVRRSDRADGSPALLNTDIEWATDQVRAARNARYPSDISQDARIPVDAQIQTQRQSAGAAGRADSMFRSTPLSTAQIDTGRPSVPVKVETRESRSPTMHARPLSFMPSAASVLPLRTDSRITSTESGSLTGTRTERLSLPPVPVPADRSVDRPNGHDHRLQLLLERQTAKIEEVELKIRLHRRRMAAASTKKPPQRDEAYAEDEMLELEIQHRQAKGEMLQTKSEMYEREMANSVSRKEGDDL